VGAVSKGIIKRDQQHNVGAYQSTYQRNPFDSNTPEEVEQYLLEVERKKETVGRPTEEYEVRMEERRPQQTHVRQAQTPPPIPSTKEIGTERNSRFIEYKKITLVVSFNIQNKKYCARFN
jgi:hypothetical protein